jgi:hypothetical protein
MQRTLLLLLLLLQVWRHGLVSHWCCVCGCD